MFRVCLQTQAARSSSVAEVLHKAAATGLALPMHLFGAMNYARSRASAAGVALSALRSDKQDIERVARRHYGGDVALATEMRSAEELLGQLLSDYGGWDGCKCWQGAEAQGWGLAITT